MSKMHSQKAIIDMDCRELGIPADRPRCDYIFAGATEKDPDRDCLASIEIKRADANTTEFHRQLKGGAQFAEERLAPESVNFHFRPVAVYGGKVHKDDINRLKGKRIQFRGGQYEIKLVRSGSSIATALG